MMHGLGCRCSLSRRGFLAQGAATIGSAALPALAAPRPPRVDVHHHYFPPAYLVPLERWAQKAGVTALWPSQRDWSVARDLEEMDRNGVDTAILSISTPGVYFGDAGQARDMARLCNDYGARLVADHPGRFGLFAVLPLPDVDACLREIAYAHDVLKADGVVMTTSSADKWPGDPAFAAIFDELNRRRSVAYFHPLAPNCCGALLPGVSGSPMEYLFDTTRAVVSLLVNGTLERCPDVRFLFSHAGGTIPMAAGRIVNALKGRKDIAAIAPEGIDRQFQKLFYDTANSYYAPTMAALRSYIPAQQILFGTDYPYVSLGQTIDGLQKLALAPAEFEAIMGTNATRLIPRLAAAP
jgi:predicted TIM-barrel fold metal-dependent hydrolase